MYTTRSSRNAKNFINRVVVAAASRLGSFVSKNDRTGHPVRRCVQNLSAAEQNGARFPVSNLASLVCFFLSHFDKNPILNGAFLDFSAALFCPFPFTPWQIFVEPPLPTDLRFVDEFVYGLVINQCSSESLPEPSGDQLRWPTFLQFE